MNDPKPLRQFCRSGIRELLMSGKGGTHCAPSKKPRGARRGRTLPRLR